MKVQGQQQVQFAFMFCAVEAKTYLIWQCLCMIPKMDKWLLGITIVST